MARNLKTDENGNDYIILEPHWCNLFENAIWQVRAVVKAEEGKDFITEMLEFGKRMWRQQCEDCYVADMIPASEED